MPTPLETALDMQNNPNLYKQQDQEKLEKELLNSGNNVEYAKWLQHPCTKALLSDLTQERLNLIDKAENMSVPVLMIVPATLKKVIASIERQLSICQV